MRKEHTLVMLPAGKANYPQLFKSDTSGDINYGTPYQEDINKPQHLYILSDGDVKEGGFAIWYGKDNQPFIKKVIGQRSFANENEFLCSGSYEMWIERSKLSNIIATTDPDLWIHKETIIGNVRDIEQVGVPKIGLDFAKRYVKEWNRGNRIDKVMLEYDTVTASRGNESHPPEFIHRLKLRPHGSVIISAVDDRRYTKAEVVALLERYEPDAPNKRKIFIEQNL